MAIFKKNITYKPEFDFDVEKFLDVVQEQLEWTGMAEIERRKTGSVTFMYRMGQGLFWFYWATAWKLMHSVSKGRIFVDNESKQISCNVTFGGRTIVLSMCIGQIIGALVTVDRYFDWYTRDKIMFQLGSIVVLSGIGYFWERIKIKSSFTYFIKTGAAKAKN